MKFVVMFLLFVAAAGLLVLNLSLGVFDDLLPSIREEAVSLKKRAVADFALQEPKKEISLPPPLKIFGPAPSASLSASGVLQWTNAHREKAGLALLQRSPALEQIAQRKIQDMLSDQYFAHVSPAGIRVSDLAEEAGYEFIAIGENLALGNYAGNEALVQAWVDSPGHRENILGSRYKEIGIAVEQGLFEGSFTLLAVQVFALPVSACDVPDENLKEEIDTGKAQIEELGAILEQMRFELEAQRPRAGPGYKKKAEEYNALVGQHNILAGEVRKNIAQYNIQVQAFNECAG